MRSHTTALRKEAPALLARYRYPIEWHRGKGTWSAWPVGLPVVAMDTTREKTRRKLYRAIESHLECLMERGLPPHVVANQLGHTDGGALVQRLYGHPSERTMRDQVRLAFAEWGAGEEERERETPGKRRLSH